MTEGAVWTAIKTAIESVLTDRKSSHRDVIRIADRGREMPRGHKGRTGRLLLTLQPRLAALATETVKTIAYELTLPYRVDDPRIEEDGSRIESVLRGTTDTDLYMVVCDPLGTEPSGQGSEVLATYLITVLYAADVEVATNTART